MNVKEGQGVKEERPIHRLYLGHQCLILFVLLPKGWLYSNQPTLLNDPNKYYFPIDKASRNTCLLLFFHSLYAEWGAESASETLTQKRRTDTDTRKQSQNTLLSSPTPESREYRESYQTQCPTHDYFAEHSNTQRLEGCAGATCLGVCRSLYVFYFFKKQVMYSNFNINQRIEFFSRFPCFFTATPSPPMPFTMATNVSFTFISVVW